jgi:adenosylmethionine-8-amino-7-oxononanoate aminotransferase
MDLDELVFHPWVVQGPRDVPTLGAGSGSYVIDVNGRRYLDFSSQLVFTNLGHQHPRIVAAIKEQADRLCTLAPGHASDVRGEAARLIVEVAPDRLGHVLFTTGGTEAIEHAVRMARLYTGRPKVLAAYRSYHGSTCAPTASARPASDRDLDPPHRRPAPLGLGHRHGGCRPLLRSIPVQVGVRVEYLGGRERAGARPASGDRIPDSPENDRYVA